jgi:hypothetical protein
MREPAAASWSPKRRRILSSRGWLPPLLNMRRTPRPEKRDENAQRSVTARRSGRPKKWRDALAGVTDADLREVQTRVANGRWRVNSRAKRWVGYAVASALKLDALDKTERLRISAMLEKWIKIGALVVVKTRDASRQKRSFVEVGTLMDVLHHSAD